MAEERVALTKRDRLSIAWRHQFLQARGTTNVCRMAAGAIR